MQSTLSRPQVEVFQLQGYLNASNAAEVQQQLTEAVASRQQSALLIDMAKVDHIDSAGLMALVAALSLAQSLNRPLSLCSISPSVRIIFELTQLDRVFKIFADQAAFAADISLVTLD